MATLSSLEGKNNLIKRFAGWLLQGAGWEKIVLIALIMAAPLLAFHNLRYNPRPWHDEGSYLSIPKALVEDGVYATRSSDGYQTFGAVQSLGPTVLIPIAISFKLFGIGLVQARIVSATYLLITLTIFYLVGLELFGRRTGLFALILLIASPAPGFLVFGRPVLGEVPALGFFLAGWLAWVRGVRTKRNWLHVVAGLLIGTAIVTKSQYMIIGFATLALLSVFDIVYYRLGNFRQLVIVALVAAVCVAAWIGWQVVYFGSETFLENAAKMRQLADTSIGFNLHSTIDAFRFLFGSGTGHFYFFWGFLSLVYIIALSRKRNQESFSLAWLVVFVCLWLGYFTFWIIPWSRYLFPAAAITALFVSKLFVDLANNLASSGKELWEEMRQFILRQSNFSPGAMMALGTLLALTTLGLWTGYQLQKVIRSDVLDRAGVEMSVILSPPQFGYPEQVAAFLNENIDKDSVIETWERELVILTEHKYHFPDQSLLAQAHVAKYRSGPKIYLLDADYFASVRPAYVVVGWYARFNEIYDTEFLERHGSLLASIGGDQWRYDIYELHLP